MDPDDSDANSANTGDVPDSDSSTDMSTGGNGVSEAPQRPEEDDPADQGDDVVVVGELPRTEDVLRKFAALGAAQAFQIDPAVLEQFRVSAIDLAASIKTPDLSKLIGPEVIESLRLPAMNIPAFEIPETFWNSVNMTSQFLRDSASIDSLYSAAQLAIAGGSRSTSRPRASRSPEAFFTEHVVEIRNVRSLLKALSRVQAKQHVHRPVWRGQQDATWAVHSSLYRRLEATGRVDEDRLVTAESSALHSAREWGMRARRPTEFFAKLQHHGAPTRLLDATVDPEVAVWFAVEAHPELDEVDGLVLGWGRAPRIGTDVVESAESAPNEDGVPFWHAWTNSEQRHRVDWGTGTRTWTWFPPALSDRMRAQRAGFLIEAGPILTDDVVDVFSEELSLDWRASEIARATSIVGLPSRHDVLTKPNGANLVPVFSFRILATAKREIRDYLAKKGLTYSAVYPDLGGLVQHLTGPFGPR